MSASWLDPDCRCSLKLLNENSATLHIFNLGNVFPKNSSTLPPSVKVLDYPLPHRSPPWTFPPHLTALSNSFISLAAHCVKQCSVIYPKTSCRGCLSFLSVPFFTLWFSDNIHLKFPPPGACMVEKGKTKTGCSHSYLYNLHLNPFIYKG